MVTWTPPQRSEVAEKIYAAAEADRAARPERYRLGVEATDTIVERATAEHGVEGLGDPAQWRPGLEQYLRSAAEDGRLNAVGIRNAQDAVVGKLRARSIFHRTLRENPEVGEREVGPPIVIIGGWRTGTTFLYRLLARDPRLRAPRPLELYAPWRAAKLTPDEREQLITAQAAEPNPLHVLNPSMAAVHDSGPLLPEECVLGMGTTLRNWGFGSTMRLDSYSRWLATQYFAREYAAHRTMLQILDDGSRRRWLLKAPAHTPELAHLAQTYPGVCIVHLHRDIVETVASGASLFATYRSTYSDEVDGHDVGRFQVEQSELWFRRALEFRASPAAEPATILDLDYRDLVSRPEATVARVYAAADIDPPDVTGMLAEHNAAQPHHGKGRHRYTPEEFGIDASELRERMTFYTDAVAEWTACEGC
ncbi:sulfotransferase [Gordonia jinghuaiqii]|uniref:Sulfotransferase n=1 Tax=Gordonia jinghuaiqii TaxID=2758710 RepID=A0A7D7LR25_9ACTN|nr:sulfotransferase [Gordonia jinghuaiqii]MCR5978367.1 sulfotransferase [Gordonia jinghuaiqii]QMT01200.1 sulfotransferase [Gordonia jinghuaiqii]